MEFKDYYKTLGVERGADKAEIKRAFRKLARKYHPDVNKEADAEDRFKEVNEAYEVLKDSEKRAAYDQLGANWQSGEQFRPPPGWDAGFEFSGKGFEHDNQSGQDGRQRYRYHGQDEHFSDFFDSLFGHAYQNTSQQYGPGRRHQKSSDHHAKIVIDIEDSIQGLTKTITLQTPKYNSQGQLQPEKRTLHIKIPKGITAGQHIRLSGQAGSEIEGVAAGDLYLEIEFKPHAFYRAEGKDLFYDLPITPWEAALGAKVSVPTPKGKVDLTIPPNSKSGQQLRLTGQGLPGKTAGNLMITLKIAVPPADTEQARNAYREMEKQFSFNPREKLKVE